MPSNNFPPYNTPTLNTQNQIFSQNQKVFYNITSLSQKFRLNFTSAQPLPLTHHLGCGHSLNARKDDKIGTSKQGLKSLLLSPMRRLSHCFHADYSMIVATRRKTFRISCYIFTFIKNFYFNCLWCCRNNFHVYISTFRSIYFNIWR